MATAKTSAAATFGLVFGLSALFCALTAILAPAAVLFGLIGLVVGLVGIKKGKLPHVTGHKLAIAGVITHVPAGLGVLEAVFIALLSHQLGRNELLAALILYRFLYYLAPLLLACYVAWRPSAMTMIWTFGLGAIVLSLLLLPRIKGAFVGLQWARRMHGFGDPAPLLPS